MHRLIMAGLALSLLAAGCLDPTVDDAGQVAAPEVPGAPFGETIETEGPVTTERRATGWEARQTLTFENGVAEAVRAGVSLDIGAGSIVARPVSDGSYLLTVELVAQASEEQTARDALESMKVRHEDAMQGTDLMVALVVETPPFTPGGILPIDTGVSRQAHVAAELPSHLAYGLTTDAGSGSIDIGALGGPKGEASTGSGAITVQDATFDVLELEAGSGSITVEDAVAQDLRVDTGSGSHRVTGAFDAITAESGSGSQNYEVTARSSGAYAFDAGSGTVQVTLERAPGQAFDVEADNGSGPIDVDISDGQPVGPQDDDHVHVRSTGYADADIQTAITAETGSGAINVHD